MGQYRFFRKEGAKPWVFEADSLDEALQDFKDALAKRGDNSDPFKFKVQEPGETHEELVANQSKAMNAGIKEAQKQGEESAQRDRGIPETFARGVTRLVAPYSVETMETTGEVSPRSVVSDMAQGAMLGTIPFAKSMLGLAGASAVPVGLDVAQQESLYGEVDPLRTGLDVGFAGLPVAGKTFQKVAPNLSEKLLLNTFLPKQATMNNPNPPDFKRGLEEGLFRGFGKYSALDKIEQKLAPMWAELERAKASGSVVDIERARKSAIKQIKELPDAWADERAEMLKHVDDIFESEKNANTYLYPEESHLQSDLNVPMFNRDFNTAKAKETIARKKWLKSGDPDALPPHIEKPSPFTQDYWDEVKVVDKPAETKYEWPLPVALSRKSGMQKRAYGKDITKAKAKQKAEIFTARGTNNAIEESSPEAREAIAKMAPYMAIKKVMEDRAMVGGSNSPIGLKDIVAAAVSPVFGALSLFGKTPLAAQALYDVGKRGQYLGSFAGALGTSADNTFQKKESK